LCILCAAFHGKSLEYQTEMDSLMI
jgi:hypothetical protein